ncbi:hypothetical protein Cgig2_029091 [Carnegiea gigantea]|uniref:Uncharacterized protein n=1 Tax=Carnegiea gigantea TaxID=171969 RepID=A0A9Q1QFN4_9CARY|nr:hypothetical protein Cgig2_029091 [Carnegiea gigantea]
MYMRTSRFKSMSNAIRIHEVVEIDAFRRREAGEEGEVETDDDEKPISLVHNKNKKNPQRLLPPPLLSLNPRRIPFKTRQTPSTTQPKKEEPDFDDDKKSVTKDDKGSRGRKRGEGRDDGKKRERKVYHLPGQKRDPPEERDPLRIFYETLYEQKPTSELAAVWKDSKLKKAKGFCHYIHLCRLLLTEMEHNLHGNSLMMESGLLPLEEAKLIYEKKLSGKIRKIASPTKPLKAFKETKSVTVKKKVEPSTPNTSNKKKATTETTTVSKRTKKSRAESSEDPSSDEDSGEEFVMSTKKVVKKVKAN